jgi:cobalt-zinc-cadmium efflux system membrane fusion protein
MNCLGARCLALSIVALAGIGASCHATQASESAASLHPGEVWLTPAEVADAHIEVAPVTEQVVDDTIVTSGTITLDDMRTAHVYSPVTGRVVKVEVQLGQRVKRGDALAIIESPDVGTALSDEHKAEADLIAAEHDLSRKRDLFAQNAAAAADVEASEDAERNAKAELERARQKVFLLRSGNVDAVSQTFTLTSPIDGEVLLWNIGPGMEVQGQYSGGASAPVTGSLVGTTNPGELFTIGELDKVWVLGDIYEIDLARVHIGQHARVTTVTYPGQVFDGTVDWISGSLDPNTRTAKVRCTFDNPDRKLRPMMYSTVRIAVDQRKALAIPRSAILHLGEYKVVFVQVGDTDGKQRFERLPIDVDDSDETPYVAVRHGVEAGQKIVVNGAAALLQKL